MLAPLETAELLAFTKTVDSHSLSRAAAEMGVPRATLSRRLARLEQRLGARLLRRTTRSLTLTDAGEALYRHARIVLDAVTHAENSVRKTDNAIRGDLRVSVFPLPDMSFRALVCDFAQRYPEVRLQLHLSTRHVDLMRDGYDVAIRATGQLEPGLVARLLARVPMVAVASPAYLAEHGTPRSRKELRQHRCLMSFARGELPQTHWHFGRGKQQVEGSFFSNDMTVLCTAAERGLGVALLPMIVAREALANGTLVRILPGVFETESGIYIVYAEREFLPPHVRAFVDAVVAWAPTGLQKDLPPLAKLTKPSNSKVTAPRTRKTKRPG